MWKRLPGGAEAGLSPEGVDILGEILQNPRGYLQYNTAPVLKSKSTSNTQRRLLQLPIGAESGVTEA